MMEVVAIKTNDKALREQMRDFRTVHERDLGCVARTAHSELKEQRRKKSKKLPSQKDVEDVTTFLKEKNQTLHRGGPFCILHVMQVHRDFFSFGNRHCCCLFCCPHSRTVINGGEMPSAAGKDDTTTAPSHLPSAAYSNQPTETDRIRSVRLWALGRTDQQSVIVHGPQQGRT
jgi:hypothetical protein